MRDVDQVYVLQIVQPGEFARAVGLGCSEQQGCSGQPSSQHRTLKDSTVCNLWQPVFSTLAAAVGVSPTFYAQHRGVIVGCCSCTPMWREQQCISPPQCAAAVPSICTLGSVVLCSIPSRGLSAGCAVFLLGRGNVQRLLQAWQLLLRPSTHAGCTACFQSTFLTSSSVLLAVRSYQVPMWWAAGCCSPTLLAGKEWLYPAYLQPDRHVLLMGPYCFMVEEMVWLSEDAAVACGGSIAVQADPAARSVWHKGVYWNARRY